MKNLIIHFYIKLHIFQPNEVAEIYVILWCIFSEYFYSLPLSFMTDFNTLISGNKTNLNFNYDINTYQSTNTIVETVFNPNIFDQSIINFTQIQSIGQGLYTYGAFWLILCSIILLLAMVSPIFISKK